MAGCDTRRGKGKYALTIVLLVYCSLGKIPIVQSMSGITYKQLQSALNQSLAPVTEELHTVKVAFQSEISTLKHDTDKKYSDLADRITKIESSQMPTYAAMTSMPATSTSKRMPANKEDYNKELDAAQKPRGYRFRGDDYEARMRATKDERDRHEANFHYAYRSLGFYPCGDQEDRDQSKTELQQEGFVNPSDTAIEKRCVKNFLVLDMGMTEPIFEEVAGDVEKIWFEGKTAFCKFVDRRAVAIVYSFASLMNKMAKNRHVVRKLHLWIPPSLEARFFQLKDLEWNFRRMKKAKNEFCHSRITYEGETIVAQWRSNEGDPYQKIEEPASQHIPGIEFSRITSSKALNNRGKKPLPLPKPDPKATTPKGRECPVKAARSRGGGRGGRGGRGGGRGGRGGGPPATGANATPVAPKADATPGTNSNAIVIPAGAEANQRDRNEAAMETNGSLNTKAVGQTAESNSQSSAGSKRGRKPKATPS